MDENKKEINTSKKTSVKKTTPKKDVNKKENMKKTVKKVSTKKQEEPKEEKVEIKEEVESNKDKIKKEEKKSQITLKTNIAVVTCILLIALGMIMGTVLMLLNYNFNFIGFNKSIVAADEDLRNFIDVYNEISNEYYGDVDKQKAIEAATASLVASLGDSNTNYLSKEETEDLSEQLRGNYEGIGAEITQRENNVLEITYIFEGSPAQKGLKVGDILKKVDGKDVTGQSVSEVASKIKGTRGTTVSVTVERNKEEKTYKLVRGSVNIDSVSSKVLEKNDKKVGVITIELFGERTAIEFENKLKELEKDKINKLIIDVRYNSGGYLEKAGDIISLFLNKKQVMYQLKDKKGSSKVYSLKDSKRKMDVVVLINEYSASASEILAAAIKESYNGKLVGIKSFGKGTVQTTKPLSNGSMVKMTTQEWLTPKGNEINKKGIEPDIKVEQTKAYYENPKDENDAQLQKALEEITK